jgi:thymidylate synthase
MEDLNSFFEEKNMEEYQYLNLVSDIIEKGTWEEGRNGKTKSIFGGMMRFSLKDGKIPILTTKKNCLENLFKGTFMVYQR